MGRRSTNSTAGKLAKCTKLKLSKFRLCAVLEEDSNITKAIANLLSMRITTNLNGVMVT